MLTDKLSKLIIDGAVPSVYANATNEDLKQPVSVFDGNLNSLCMKLRKITPRVVFSINSSTEKYEIVLRHLTPIELEAVSRVFAESPINISDEYHFGGLF